MNSKKPSPQSPAQRLDSLRNLLASGDIAGGEQEAHALCLEYPTNAGAFALYARCASLRKDWSEALSRWQDCRDRFLAKPQVWRLGLAYALLNFERFSEAEVEFSAALAETADPEPALAGLAQIARRAPLEFAEPLWSRVLTLAPSRVRPTWQARRARALAQSGQLEQAYQLLSQALADAAEPLPSAFALLASLLIETGRRGRAAAELENGRLRRGGGASDCDRLWLQSILGETQAARASFFAALAAARSAADLTALLEPIPLVFETFERAEAWRVMRRACLELPANDPAVACLQLRLDLALRDYSGFVTRLAVSPPQVEPWASHFRKISTVLTASQFPDFDAPKVFVIGLSRTGTSSMDQALTRLGYLCAHFRSPFSFEALAEDDFALFDAASDTPVAMRFEMLYAMYPNAKFILTERPYEAWSISVQRYFEMWFGTADFTALRQRDTRRDSTIQGADVARIHAALYYAYPKAHAAYDAYNQRVGHFFAGKPANKLLRHNVFSGDGWATLCDFLGRTVPSEPYPWLNKLASSSS